MDLNKEAEQYAKSISKNQTYREYLEESFKAGVHSKYAQAKIIQGQIDVLRQHIEHPTKPGYRRHDVLNSIKKLEQQLKQLENEVQ
jgi:flagellar biosynthesis chaperone FliJ